MATTGAIDPSTRATDRSVRATDRSAKHFDRSAKATDQSVRATDRSAKATDQSVRATDRSARVVSRVTNVLFMAGGMPLGRGRESALIGARLRPRRQAWHPSTTCMHQVLPSLGCLHCLQCRRCGRLGGAKTPPLRLPLAGEGASVLCLLYPRHTPRRPDDPPGSRAGAPISVYCAGFGGRGDLHAASRSVEEPHRLIPIHFATRL